MKTYFVLGAIALFLSTSCGNSTNTAESTKESIVLQQFTTDRNAERINLFLGFTEETETDSSMIYIAKSLFDTDTVGLKVEVLKDIQPGINSEGRPVENGFVKGVIKLSSIGVESDNLVKALSSLYKIPVSGGMTNEVILPTVFSSNMNVVDLSKPSAYSFKLFLDNPKGEVSELSFTVDTYRKGIDIGEYNPSFREYTISAFQGN